MPLKSEHIDAALVHLRQVDSIMSDLIEKAGPFTLKLDRNRFGMLVRSILSQQISTNAARAIRLRLDQLLLPEKLSPEAIANVTDEQLRAVGLSGQKVSYLRDLSARVLDNRLRLDRIGRMNDEAAIEHLIQVHGIGRWTAQMFLIFSLGRLDIFPHDDLIVRSSIRELYGLEELPDKRTSHEIAQLWSPYRSVAAWYCWRLIDVKKDSTFDASQYPV
ncbi:MAG: alkA 1 [Schlesneria sp.]|nr:alkA 1 [Schlesneria sp.]